MSEQRALEIGSIAAGVRTRLPQLIVHQAASTLRQLFDRGEPISDPRCQALIQLVNSARLVLLPNSNDGAKNAADLTSNAVHIDVSTATVAAIMGLKNATTLSGAAVTEVNKARINGAERPSSGDPSALKLKLYPKLSHAAFNALVQLVKTDQSLGSRARNEAQQKSSSMAHKIHKLRAGQRHANVRKRRLAGEIGSDPDAGDGRRDPMDIPPLPPSSSGPVAPIISTPAMHSFQTPTLYRRPNLVFGNPVSTHTLNPTRVASANLPPTHPPRPPPRLSPSDTAPSSTEPSVQHPTSFSRFRSKHANQQDRPEKCVQEAIASHKGVMNDTVGTPDDIMEAFLHPVNVTNKAHHDTLDNQSKIRSVLAERERIVYRLQKRRRAELAAMPLGMTEQTRRNAIIEAKQLALLDLQRVVRYRVCAEMKKMHSLAVQEDGCVPTDHLSRLFRRRDPPIYSYTDGYPRITPFDGIPEMPPRHPETISQDSIRMAQFDMSRMVTQKDQRKKEFHRKFALHLLRFRNNVQEEKNARLRIFKGFERYLLEKKRAEERRRKLERIERLRLLRSNDEQAYLNLLKDTKNERLLQLVRQTDNYLMRIGAQVERQRESQDTAGINNTFVEELGEDGTVPIDAMRRRRDLYYTVTHAVLEEVRQPSIMVHGTLKSYQLEGLKWMVSLYNNNLNGILADEMGLGKTIQTIALVTYLVETKKNPGPYLIIVPLSTMGNWVRELDLWAPSLVKVVYRGDKTTRKSIQNTEMAEMNFNILLTTYEFTVKDQQILSQLQWKYIIIDEGHRMKNANCKLAMTLGVKYKSRNRLLLTGTPLQNNLTELWALLNFLLPTIFSSSDTFETWFKQPFETTALGDSAELEEEETLLVINRLHQVLRPFLLRRLKADVESQLPQKVEHVVHCDMSAWQRVIYRQVKSRIGLATGGHNGGVKSFNNLLMQCKKICNHPYLFYHPEAIDHLPQNYLIRASGKFALLRHLLPKLQLHGHRTLIFSQMTAALDYLEFFLSLIGIQYLRLDGTTRSDGRQELLNRFNDKDSPYFCFLLSTRAGGLGLNLQTADTVIIFDSDWNPMMDLQAQDRAHRIGQTKVVRVYRLICAGTVEEKILEQANRKLQVDAQIIQAGQFNNKSTEMDRHQMLKDLLRQKNEDDRLGDVPSTEELNQLFARTDEEYESFVAHDKKMKDDGTFVPLFVNEDELPEWVLRPDVDHKTAEEKEQEILLSHGRGRRKRKRTHDMDMLSEAEWFKVVEGDMSVEEAFKRREARKERQVASKGRIGSESDEIEPSTDGTNRTSVDPDMKLGELVSSMKEEDGNRSPSPVDAGDRITNPDVTVKTDGAAEEDGAELERAHAKDGKVAESEQAEQIQGSDEKELDKKKRRKSQLEGETRSGKDRAFARPVFGKIRLRIPSKLSSPTHAAKAISELPAPGKFARKRKREEAKDDVACNGDAPTQSFARTKKRKAESIVEGPVAVELGDGSKSEDRQKLAVELGDGSKSEDRHQAGSDDESRWQEISNKSHIEKIFEEAGLGNDDDDMEEFEAIGLGVHNFGRNRNMSDSRQSDGDESDEGIRPNGSNGSLPYANGRSTRPYIDDNECVPRKILIKPPKDPSKKSGKKKDKGDEKKKRSRPWARKETKRRVFVRLRIREER